jgi:hypothetical protein
MKKMDGENRLNNRTMRVVIIIAGVLIVGLANSGGPGVTQRRDRTGSPIALNSNCSSCHFGGDYDGEISLTVLKDSTAVEEYGPGEEYVLKVAFEQNGEGVQYGFQMVAMMGEELVNAGSFGELPEFIRKISLYNNQFDYVEHTRPLNDSVWYIPWMAPEDGAEPISFYLAGLVTNDNSTTSGDEVVWLGSPHILNPAGLVSRKENLHQEALNFQIRQNPVVQEIQLVSSWDWSRESAWYQITQLSGKVVKSGPLLGTTISVYDLSNGGYFLTIYVKKTLLSQMFIVQ